jgi:isoleucyl-tRNA synthetase
MAKWTRLRALRDPVRKEIETLRAEGKVGSSLQAEVDFGAAGEDYELLASLDDDLKFLLLTSAARIRRTGEREVKVRASEHPKCERCWHYRADVNDEALCGRCQSNLRGAGEARRHV